ncbi:7TMR-DISM extracellular 2 [Polaribacter sp. KT25b]|uniref:7TM diverse intracellular signaling domain-containing protein n=1 Tax=Polaribacter sp. KT25b TaxID=1855336 RepID=UPI00087B9709|nr:7TM diverse intracellular signaling domain-containing protein [Polaribacter sp. KT25b]SDS01226.1 7TMR-DISM extracellular 2 [Polaribacter sp. KT25b]
MKYIVVTFILFFHAIVFSQKDVYFYKDVESTLTLENVKDQEFLVLENQILEKHSQATYWFKIPAYNTNLNYIFRIPYDRFNTANVYQNSKSIEKLTNRRYLSYRFSRDNDVYIQVIPKLHSYIPVEFGSEEIMSLREKNNLLLNGFYYGFAILIIIYNLFYYFLFKDNSFLYYSLFLSNICFGIFTMDGMLNYYNINEGLNDFLMCLNYVLLAYFSSKFSDNFLFLDIFFPKLKRYSYGIGIIILFLAVFYVTTKNYYFLFFLNILVFLLLFINWFCAVLLFNKNVYTKILAIAYVIILFSAIDFFILKFLGISLIDINAVTIKIGAFLEMIILSIAVLYRMKILKDENIHIRNEIIKYSLQLKNLTSINDKTNININILSFREREVFDLICAKKSNKEISSEINISINTVKFHVKNIYEKLNVKSRQEVFILKNSFKK